MSRGKQMPARWVLMSELVRSMAANPEVYKGTAEDAARLPKLADQVLTEFLSHIDNVGNPSDEANKES